MAPMLAKVLGIKMVQKLEILTIIFVAKFYRSLIYSREMELEQDNFAESEYFSKNFL